MEDEEEDRRGTSAARDGDRARARQDERERRSTLAPDRVAWGGKGEGGKWMEKLAQSKGVILDE